SVATEACEVIVKSHFVAAQVNETSDQIVNQLVEASENKNAITDLTKQQRANEHLINEGTSFLSDTNVNNSLVSSEITGHKSNIENLALANQEALQGITEGYESEKAELEVAQATLEAAKGHVSELSGKISALNAEVSKQSTRLLELDENTFKAKQLHDELVKEKAAKQAQHEELQKENARRAEVLKKVNEMRRASNVRLNKVIAGLRFS
ncbi:MAG TPA: hypothetical protein PLV25_00375, partial [Opitutales bacterium]|nr:hypothetical protein [Opitutales bacterium]